MNKPYHNFQGIKTFMNKNRVEVDSLKLNKHLIFNRPFNEIPKEIQRKKGINKSTYKIGS